jgi:hypothetical protein
MKELMIRPNQFHTKMLPSPAQGGFAAFAVTLILTVVLTLIVLGFAANSRNEQTRALDAQLDAAAYYAAESGINDAYSMIKTDFTNGKAIPSQTNSCTGSYLSTILGISTGTLTPGSATSSGAAAYTCLLVNPTPLTLEYAPLDAGQGQVVPLFGINPSTQAATAVNSVAISWQEFRVASNFSNCPKSTINTFKSSSVWSTSNCTAGILQVDIVPASGWTSPTDLQNATETVFLEPQSSYNDNSAKSVVNGSVIPAVCGSGGGEYGCSVTLDNLPASPTGSLCTSASGGCYYLHIVPVYSDTAVSVTATGSSGLGNIPLDFADAQATIDSTGKAGDQLKRIQEYVSINPVGNNNAPVNTLQGLSGVCKQFSTYPGYINGEADAC